MLHVKVGSLGKRLFRIAFMSANGLRTLAMYKKLYIMNNKSAEKLKMNKDEQAELG